MTEELVSEIQIIPYSQEKIFDALSTMENLEKVKNNISNNKIQNIIFEKNSCSFSTAPVGEVKFLIIERDPPNMIKFTADPSPIKINMWIHLLPISANETQMKLTVKAELNIFLKGLFYNPLRKMLNEAASTLASIPYDKIE
jgi:hypothetical protein